jgi:hypothetical protein
MPPKKVLLWKHFHKGEKQNTSHFKAYYCLGCINHNRPAFITSKITDGTKYEKETWFKEGTGIPNKQTGILIVNWVVCAAVGHIHGEKSVMVAHLIGTKPCDYASNEAKALAWQLQLGDTDKVTAVEGNSEKDENGPGPAKKEINRVAQSMRQTELKVFRGIAIPFNAEQIIAVRRQFLQATISANLPFQWADDVEVIKLFMMFRSTADSVIPSQKTLAGRLLNEENEKVEEALVKKLKGRYRTIL